MTQHGGWSPYSGNSALFLAVTLFVIAGVLIYWGTRLPRSIGVSRPGRALSVFLVTIWVLAVATFLVAVATYVRELVQQVGPFTAPPNPITPVTALSGLVTFIAIIFLNRQHGWKAALGSAVVGAAAGPMIFELPFDLIVMWRTFPPAPATPFTLLFFLPLFLVEISTFSLLTLSPVLKLSKYTMFSLAAMFLVFSVWALFGFSYPSTPLPIALNGLSKILSFVAAITLFLPYRGTLIQSR